MKPGTVALLVAVLGGGAFVLGRETAATVVRERVVASRVPPMVTRCDEGAIAARVARALEAPRDAPPAVAEAPAPLALSPEQEAAAARARDGLDAARARGHWSAEDAEALRAALRELPPEARDQALRDLSAALSRGELVADVLPPV